MQGLTDQINRTRMWTHACFLQNQKENEDEKNLFLRCRITVCPSSSDPIYIVNYYRKWVTTSCTYCNI